MRKALVLAALVGCSSAPPAPVAPSITLSLSNATVREAALAFASATGEPLAITPDAEPFADCVRLSLLVPTPRPVPEVAGLLEAPLGSRGFTLSRDPAGWTLAHAGASPIECAPLTVARSIDLTRRPTAPPPPPAGPVTETSVEISRADADGWRENQDELMRSARILPHEEGGAVIGIRLFGIRATSPLAQLGFRNGDTVYAVNGHSLASPDAMLEAYAALRDASEYVVDLSRSGERIRHVIRVVD